jgi:hypothetical protein
MGFFFFFFPRSFTSFGMQTRSEWCPAKYGRNKTPPPPPSSSSSSSCPPSLSSWRRTQRRGMAAIVNGGIAAALVLAQDGGAARGVRGYMTRSISPSLEPPHPNGAESESHPSSGRMETLCPKKVKKGVHAWMTNAVGGKRSMFSLNVNFAAVAGKEKLRRCQTVTGGGGGAASSFEKKNIYVRTYFFSSSFLLLLLRSVGRR